MSLLAAKQKMKNDLKKLRNEMKDIDDPNKADDIYVEKIVEIFYNFVKSGEVTFVSGNVNGTCPPNGGPLTIGTAKDGKIT